MKEKQRRVKLVYDDASNLRTGDASDPRTDEQRKESAQIAFDTARVPLNANRVVLTSEVRDDDDGGGGGGGGGALRRVRALHVTVTNTALEASPSFAQYDGFSMKSKKQRLERWQDKQEKRGVHSYKRHKLAQRNDTEAAALIDAAKAAKHRRRLARRRKRREELLREGAASDDDDNDERRLELLARMSEDSSDLTSSDTSSEKKRKRNRENREKALGARMIDTLQRYKKNEN